MKLIYSADLVRYNANSRGTRTGDCAVRSISLAFNRSYNDIKKLLNSAMNCLAKESALKQPVRYRMVEEPGC